MNNKIQNIFESYGAQLVINEFLPERFVQKLQLINQFSYR